MLTRAAVAERTQLDKRKQVIVGQERAEWYRRHVVQWGACQLCPLSSFREHVVHFRGIIPAPICFIGEAPGVSEDERGLPFVGPAGMLLDELFEEAGVEDGHFCLINTTACIPYSPGDEIVAPEKACVKVCSPRVHSLLEQINPQLIVALGRISTYWMTQFSTRNFIELTHPAAMLYQQKSPTQAAITHRRFVVTLRAAVEKLNLQ